MECETVGPRAHVMRHRIGDDHGPDSGKNPIDELDLVRLVRHHWFAGSGMAHGLRLCGGKAEWFRSRFVLDRDAAKVLSRKPLSGPSEGTRDGNVNTNLMNVG